MKDHALHSHWPSDRDPKLDYCNSLVIDLCSKGPVCANYASNFRVEIDPSSDDTTNLRIHASNPMRAVLGGESQ